MGGLTRGEYGPFLHGISGQAAPPQLPPAGRLRGWGGSSSLNVCQPRRRLQLSFGPHQCPFAFGVSSPEGVRGGGARRGGRAESAWREREPPGGGGLGPPRPARRPADWPRAAISGRPPGARPPRPHRRPPARPGPVTAAALRAQRSLRPGRAQLECRDRRPATAHSTTRPPAAPVHGPRDPGPPLSRAAPPPPQLRPPRRPARRAAPIPGAMASARPAAVSAWRPTSCAFDGP